MPTGTLSALSWDDLRFFDEVVRAGSIRASSRSLGVDHTTVSRRINNLERQLKVKVLVRNADGIQLTQAGEELWLATQEARGAFQSVQRRIGGRDKPLAGRVRVSTHAALGTRFLAAALVAFRKLHPRIEIELDLSSQVLDLAMNQAEIAVRVAKEPPQDSIAQRVAGFAYAVYASDNYLATHDPHRHPTTCQWVGWNEGTPYPVSLKQELFPTVPIRDRLPTILSQCQVTAAGLGLAALPCVLADAEKSLRRLSDPQQVSSVFVLRHPDHRSTGRVKELYEHLRVFLERHSEKLEGQ